MPDFKTVKLQIPTETYDKLVKARREAGMPSVGAYLLDKAGALPDADKVKEIVNVAVRKAKRQTVGKPFSLGKLFAGKVWTTHSAGVRIAAGKLFLERVEQAEDGICRGAKNASGHQLYVRRAASRPSA